MTTDHPPRLSLTVPSPDTSVTIGAVDHTPGYFHLEVGGKGRDRDVRAHAPDAKFTRLVGTEADGARSVRGQVLLFRRQLTGGAGKEQLISDEGIELGDIGRELRRTQARLGANDLWIGRTDERVLERDDMRINYR